MARVEVNARVETQMASTTRTLIGTGLVLALVVPLAGVASGQDSIPPPPGEEFDTTRGMAMGLGGSRASAASTSALEYNPANMALGRVYHIEAFAGYRPQVTNFQFGAALVDSFSAPVAMGVSYRYILGNGQYGHGGMEGRVALAYAFGDAFSIGVAGRYLSFWREGPRPEGDNRGPYAEGITMDASIRVTPVPGFHIAAIGQSLIDFGTALVPRLVGGSASYTIDNTFTLAFDGLADLSTFHNTDGSLRAEAIFGAGAELFVSGVPIRAGWGFDTGRSIHYVTAGVGYVQAEFGIDIAWRQQVYGDDDTWLLLAGRYFFH